MKKPRGDAKLKTLPDALQEELFQLLRRTTGEKAALWLFETHAVKTSQGSLSDFFSWYPRTCLLRSAATLSKDFEATIKRLPELKITAQQASDLAEINFDLIAAQNRDPELFAMRGKAILDKERLKLEREKFEETKKADWEKGLDALKEEIKGNAEAMKLFDALSAVLAKARS